MTVAYDCDQCGKPITVLTGHYNRSKSRGARIFCGRSCAGLSRRVDRSDAEKVAAKAAYDREYRAKNAKRLKAEKAEWYQRTRDPVKEAAIRKERMHLHVAYCQRPEYKKWKREYDRRYLAQKRYGEFAECFLLTQEIRKECLEQQSDYEIRLAAGTLNKKTQRRRDYDRAYSNQPETGSMGNLG